MHLLLLLAVFAQSKPITLSDYYKIETVSSPAISPDGKQIAYLKTKIIEAENRRHSELCIAAKCLTQIRASVSAPKWSPDGKLLGYTAAGKSWFLKSNDLDAQPFQIPGLDGVAVFSLDHQWIAFTKRTQLTAPKSSLTDFERLAEQRFRGRAYDWMNFRFDGRGYLPDPRTTPAVELFLLARSGGEPKQLTSLGVAVENMAWSPDSKLLAFVANMHQRDEKTYERADVFTVTNEAKLTRLTDDNHHYTNPAWSPDGKTIAVLRQESLNLILANKRTQGSPIDIYSIPATGGNLTNLTAAWDDLPGAPTFSKDGKSLYFEANLRGTGHLYRLNLASRAVEQITNDDRLLEGFDINQDAGVIAYTSTNPDTPVELFAAPLANPTKQTQITIQPTRWSLGKTERMSFDSKDGTSIEGWVTLPPNYSAQGGPYPLILNTHGGPHGAYASSFSFLHQLQAAAGYVVLYTNPRASTGYGEKFRWGTWGGWGEKDLEDVLAGVQQAINTNRIDPKRMGITGYSYGGFLTNWAIDIPRTKETEFLGTPWSETGNATMIKYSPITYAGNIKTPTLFIHGEADLRVPIAQAEELYTALKKQNVHARFVRYPGEYHGGWSPWNTFHPYQQEMNWWAQYLK